MGALEKYFGVEDKKRISDKKLQRHSQRYLAKFEESLLLRQANELFAKGNSMQCFEVLEKAVRLVPNDHKPFYLLGLIHEENGKFEKAATAYLAAAVLKKTDTSLWRKVLSISSQLESPQNEILALSKINKNEPSEALTLKKLELFKKMKKKYSVISCQIELFDYYGVNTKIFDKFEKVKHINSLRKVCSSLYRCIKRNKTARTEYFIRKTVFNMYKIKDWSRILKVLDEFYFKDNDILHPDVRILYFLAFLNADEFRIDPLLNISKLTDDIYIWKELENETFVHDLCICLKDKKRVDQAIVLLETLLSHRKTTKNLIFAADFYQEIGNLESAIYFYNEAIALDPLDPEIKSKLHSIYSKLGFKGIAKEFETHKIVSEYFKQCEDSTKSVFRYPSEKCKEIRSYYEDVLAVVPHDYEQFIERSNILLKDFFGNPFVMLKNKNFRSFTNKNEKIGESLTIKSFESEKIEQSIVPFDENSSKRDFTDKLVRISSLHGLDVEEWFYITKNCILSLMAIGRFEEALKLAMDCLNAYIFRSNCGFVMQFFFICIRLTLMSRDLDTLLIVFRDIVQFYGYSSFNLLYFLVQFFPDFYLNRQFCTLQKNVQRIIRRDFSPQNSLVVHKENDISDFLAICSFLPRFLQTETVSFITNHFNSTSEKVCTMQAIVSITHTKSRTLSDKKSFATNGFKILKKIPGDDFSKLYNLAKSYHFFGYYTHAEPLYYKVIENGPEELRKMSIFNLSLIFKHNKSKKVIRALLSKV